MTWRRVYPIIQALLAAALFGVSTPLSKALLEGIRPIPLAAFLYLGSALGAMAWYGVQRLRNQEIETEASLSRIDLPWLAGALLAGGVAAPVVLMFSLDATPASTASLLLNFEGVATTLIAAALFREAIGRRIWWAIGLVTLASILLSWNPQGRFGVSFGALGVLLACILWGLDNNLTRHISAKNPVTIVAIKGFGAGLFSLLLALLTSSPFPTLLNVGGAMLLGSVSYGLSIVLFVLALRNLGAARTSALFGSAPFIGSLLSFAIFHEVPGIRFIFSFLTMMGGVVLLVGEGHAHQHRHTPLAHEHSHRHDDEHHEHDHAVDEIPADSTHSHWHEHEETEHSHPHTPDIHHRHEHSDQPD